MTHGKEMWVSASKAAHATSSHGLLARVDEHVLAHVGPVGEGPEAVAALVGALARVCVHVHVEVPPTLESHRAVRAGQPAHASCTTEKGGPL